MIDLGTGNNNKMCVASIPYILRSEPYISPPCSEIGLWITNKRFAILYYIFSEITLINVNIQLIDIIETVYRGASKGRGLVVSPKGQLSMHCYQPYSLTPLSIRLFDTL
jgi:hypothetical protein